MCKFFKFFVTSNSQITDTLMNKDTLFYSTDVFNSLIETHRVNVQTNEHCMSNIVKIRLNNFWISHD